MINKILVFAFVGSLITASASAQNFTIEGVNYKVTNVAMKTVEIAASSCYNVAGGVFAPTTVRNDDIDYTITNIVVSAFFSCGTLISVTLPNSVTSIGNNAFTTCTNLASVILPNSVTSLREGTFGFCSKLTNITLPNTITSIGQSAFKDCTSLTSIILPNTLIRIEIESFRNTGLRSITLPNSITNIGSATFIDCTSLATVSINKVTPLTIDASVFSGVTLGGLTLKIPTGSLDAYNAKAIWSTFGTKTEIDFEFTKAGVNYVITNTEAPATVGIIKRGSGVANTCFTGDFALTEVTDNSIDYDITSIATAAFEGCTDLTAFTFPSTVTSVSSATFKGCTGLATVTLHDEIREIGNSAFENCTGLTAFTFPDNNNFTSVAEATFKGCTGLTAVTLPNSSIASIGNNAFKNCSSLATFSINKAMPLTINANVFEGASIASATLKVPTIGVSDYTSATVWSGFGMKVADPSLTDTEGFLFTKAGVNYVVTNTEDATVGIAASSCYTENSGVFALTEVVNGSPAVTYAITSIAANAFEGCIGLTGFTLPSTVTSVSSSTFKGCTGLATVTLHDNIINIGNNAFENCTGLTAFTFPDNNNFTSVAEAVFKGCTGLATITLPNSSITSIGDNAFENCTGLATFSINKVVPLAINANVFLNASIATATLNVPMAGVSAYEGADIWSGFETTQILNTESYAKENTFSIAINNDRLEITQAADKALKINRVQIINLLGQVVKTSKENSIALSNLPVGVYIVSIATKNGRFSKKFVRE